MTALPLETARPTEAPAPGGFEVGYVTEDGVEFRTPLAEAWAAPFEGCLPARRFTARKGQQHLSGLWWSATTGGHVGYESWLERDHLMLLDFGPAIVGIASQPFRLHWHETGRLVTHVPDFFARRSDGSAILIDCRPVERRPPRDVAKFEATARAYALLEWDYRLVAAPDMIVTANVRWLSGYRHPRHMQRTVAAVLREVFATPTPLLAGAQAAGEPIAVLPALFHLLWYGELTADLSVPLHEGTTVRVAAEDR